VHQFGERGHSFVRSKRTKSRPPPSQWLSSLRAARDIWARLSVLGERSFAKCCMPCRPIVLGSGVRRHSLSGARSPTFLFFSFSQLGSASRKKPASYLLYVAARTHTDSYFFLFPLHKKRGGMQDLEFRVTYVVGRRARRGALCYYHGCLRRPSADMRYLITLTPPGNKKRTRSVRMRVWASGAAAEPNEYARGRRANETFIF
jgi:hypothetical protein